MRVRWLLLLVLVSVLSLATGCTAFFVPAQADYGEETPFAAGRTVQYPDFALEYVGQHRVTSDVYPRGFLYYDFLASHDGIVQDVAWTDGTGEIGPVDFTFDGAAYTLEVIDRDGMGPFTAGQVVVRKATQ